MTPYIKMVSIIITIIFVVIVLLSINDEVYKHIGKPNPVKDAVNNKFFKNEKPHPLSSKCGTVSCEPCKMEYAQKKTNSQMHAAAISAAARKAPILNRSNVLQDELYSSCLENMVYI
jgi:hypothetical protein